MCIIDSQGVAESVGRSKSAIFGRDENSYELRSPEFPRTPSATRPEYFTVSYENEKYSFRFASGILHSFVGVFTLDKSKLIHFLSV
jgi:hypothetical protein